MRRVLALPLLVACTPPARGTPKPDRATQLLELCSVDVVKLPDEPPYLACNASTFDTPRSAHTLGSTETFDSTLYADSGVDIEGHFLSPSTIARLVVLGGETSGSNGVFSGFLFARNEAGDWKRVQTFHAFPATSCVVLPRPGKTDRFFCAFSNHWQNQTNVWASIFDATTPLDDGRLPPLERIVVTKEDAASIHMCPSSLGSRHLLPDAPLVVRSDGFDLLYRDISVEEATHAVCGDDDSAASRWPVKKARFDMHARDAEGERLLARFGIQRPDNSR